MKKIEVNSKVTIIDDGEGDYDLGFGYGETNHDLVQHGEIPVVPQDGVVKAINGERALVEYEVSGRTMCLSFPLDSLKLRSGKKEKPPVYKFILQYELEKDPFELFETMNQVRNRIKELSENRNLKRDKIFVYEVKKVRKVELVTTTSIKGLN